MALVSDVWVAACGLLVLIAVAAVIVVVVRVTPPSIAFLYVEGAASAWAGADAEYNARLLDASLRLPGTVRLVPYTADTLLETATSVANDGVVAFYGALASADMVALVPLATARKNLLFVSTSSWQTAGDVAAVIAQTNMIRVDVNASQLAEQQALAPALLRAVMPDIERVVVVTDGAGGADAGAAAVNKTDIMMETLRTTLAEVAPAAVITEVAPTAVPAVAAVASRTLLIITDVDALATETTSATSVSNATGYTVLLLGRESTAATALVAGNDAVFAMTPTPSARLLRVAAAEGEEAAPAAVAMLPRAANICLAAVYSAQRQGSIAEAGRAWALAHGWTDIFGENATTSVVLTAIKHGEWQQQLVVGGVLASLASLA